MGEPLPAYFSSKAPIRLPTERNETRGNGTEPTRPIRNFEKEKSPATLEQVKNYGRIPIIAVSASLSESACTEYVQNGFDGCILKLIGFTRLEATIGAIQDEERRRALPYGSVGWNAGGGDGW